MAKGKKRKNIVLIVAFALFVSYFGYQFVTLQLHIKEQEAILAQTQQKNEDTEIANEELSNAVENGDEHDYLEKKAREEGYVQPDERVFVDISGN